MLELIKDPAFWTSLFTLTGLVAVALINRKPAKALTDRLKKIENATETIGQDVKEIKLWKDAQEEVGDFRSKLESIEDYYLADFGRQEYRDFACLKAGTFVDVVSAIATEPFTMAETRLAMQKLRTGYEECARKAALYIPRRATAFLKAHDRNFKAWLDRIETIYTDTANNKQSRFASESAEFLKQFMKELLQQEKIEMEESHV